MDTESKLETQVALMSQVVESMKCDITEIKYAVIGDNNGRKGLVRSLDEVKAAIAFNSPQTIDARVKAIEQELKVLKWGAAIVGAATILNAISFLWDVLTHAIAIKPVP